MVIAVDFDNTLFETDFPKIIAPKWEIINWCKAQREKGNTLILWTCRQRKRLKAALKACKEVGLEFDYVNNHTRESIKRYGWSIHGCKVSADVYLDDKALNPIDLIKVMGNDTDKKGCF